MTSTRDESEGLRPAKRARLVPEYGRSASDPPLPFSWRQTNSVDMPLDSLKLEAMKGRQLAGTDLPKALRSVQSGPPR